MQCFVYVLGCEGPNGPQTYVGWTTDLVRRLAQHNTGKGAKTTRGREWMLLYAESHNTPAEAMSREWHLKRDRAFRAKLRGQ
jgi:putative endonuclease